MAASVYDRLTPGDEFVLSFAVDTLMPLAPSGIGLVLGTWAPFQNGLITVRGVSISGDLLVLTLRANQGADVFTFGGLAAATADVLNHSFPAYGFAPSGLNVVSAQAIPGLTKTTTWQEFQRAGGVTLTPWPFTSVVASGQTPDIVSWVASNWPWLLLAGAGGFFILRSL